MLAELVVILIMLITVAFVYLKGTVIKTSVLLINAFVASTVAFAYFETLGRLAIGYGLPSELAFAVVLALIFMLALVILSVVSNKLLPTDIYFGDFHDKIIRSFIAAVTGFVIAGVILTAAAMMPIGAKWPYERFNAENKIASLTKPDKSLILNADGFITSFTSWLSRGSMSGKKSFAVFHPDLLNEIYLNRIGLGNDNLAVTGTQAIQVQAAWIPETELLVSASDNNQPISGTPGTKAVVVRAGIKSGAIKDGGALTKEYKITFTMSQLRLLCKDRNSADSFAGKGKLAYPKGFIKDANTVEQKNLTDKISLSAADFSTGTKWFDLLFYIPVDTVPVLLEFKLNAVASVGRLLSGENIPPPLKP
jgi:hypothetical protein